MLISQKSQYALRATFELARQYDQGWVKIAQIAQAQAIPTRFLEIILNQLKQAGFIRSKRGSEGGYILTRSPDQLSVGDVLSFMEGPIGPIEKTSRTAPSAQIGIITWPRSKVSAK